MASTSNSNDNSMVHTVNCSIAQSNNLLYSRNVDRTRPFREQNMHRTLDFVMDDHFVYAVLTGFDDINAVRYYAAFLPMVISDKIQNRSRTLNCQQQEEFYTKLLKDAFSTVEEQFRQHKSEMLSEKAVFDIELQGNNPEHYPAFNDRLKELAHELSSGLSAVVALIHDGRVYVANIGDTRAILCRKVVTDSGQDCIRAVQLSITHDLNNADELRRLGQLGINTDLVQQKQEIGNMSLTRCLGNLWLKSFPKDFPDLANAPHDPILAEPDIASIALDPSCLFLILSSASLVETLQEALNKSDVADDLIKMAYQEFQNESARESMSQSVLNQISELHQSCFDSSSNYPRPACRQIDDITLLIRDFSVDSLGEKDNDLLANITNQFDNILSIKVDESSPVPSPDATLHDTLRTPTDQDMTITGPLRPPFGLHSKSQNHLDQDNSLQNDDEDEIDAYVDFTDLLKAYNELPVEKILMDKHILISIFLFMLVDFTVIFTFFLPEWVISNVSGEIQIGLWQMCINTKKRSKCFVSPVPTEWMVAIFFILLGCLFATLTVVTFIGSLKSPGLVTYGRWLGLATLASYCMASILIPMGFSMDAIKGEPFQLPSSFNAGYAYILFNMSIWVAAISELFAGKICLPNF